MKLVILLFCIQSFSAFAADPVPNPHQVEEEKMIKPHDGALKIEKTPAHIQGLTPAPEDQATKKTSKKDKNKNTEQDKK